MAYVRMRLHMALLLICGPVVSSVAVTTDAMLSCVQSDMDIERLPRLHSCGLPAGLSDDVFFVALIVFDVAPLIFSGDPAADVVILWCS